MASKNALGSPARDTAEWNNAWNIVRSLAAARRNALLEDQEIGSSTRFSVDQTNAATALYDEPATDPAVADMGQYARAIAEIEQASATLRRAEPALETWIPDSASSPDPQRQRSVWLLVGSIWIATVLIVACAIGTAMFLLS